MRGFTILELMGVLALAALLITTVTLSVRNVTKAELRSNANRLAATMRSTFTKAVTRNLYLRLVLDLESGEYWVEQAENRFLIGAAKEEDELKDRLEEGDDKWKQAAKVLELGGGYRIDNAPGMAKEDDPESGVPRMHRVPATESKDTVVKRETLSRNLSFDGVMTGHQREVREEGNAYIYFFPNGMVERAYIYIGDGTKTFTIMTQPLTGRIVIEPYEVEIPRDFDEEEKYEGSF